VAHNRHKPRLSGSFERLPFAGPSVGDRQGREYDKIDQRLTPEEQNRPSHNASLNAQIIPHSQVTPAESASAHTPGKLNTVSVRTVPCNRAQLQQGIVTSGIANVAYTMHPDDAANIGSPACTGRPRL